MFGLLMPTVKVTHASFNIVTGAVKIVLSAGKMPNISSIHLLSDGRFFELHSVFSHEPGHLFSGYVPRSAKISALWTMILRTDRGLIEHEVVFHPVPEMVRNPKVVLSICIPTFNRAKRVTETVRNILKSNLENIEVVVCDNASEDDTLAQLRTISDARLKIFVNDRNYGPIPNFNLALAYGSGDYVLLHSDEDIILTETLEDFTAFLVANPQIGAGSTSIGSRRYPETVIYEPGKAGLVASSNGYSYIGGFFYKRSLYDIAFLFPEYDDPAFLYPFEVLVWALVRQAAFCTYAPVVVQRGKNDVSFFPKSNGRHFNHPINLIAQYHTRCRHFINLSRNYLDETEQEAAKLRFRNMLLNQNFSMCYTISLSEKLEVLHLAARDLPGILSHKVVQSTISHALGEIAGLTGGDAAVPLRNAVAIDGENTSAAFLLADLLQSEGDAQEADRLYGQIIDNTPRKWQYFLRLIAPFSERGRMVELEKVKALLLDKSLMSPDGVIAQIRAM